MQGHLVFIDNGFFIQEANGKLTPFRFPGGGGSTRKTTINNIVSGGEWIYQGNFKFSDWQPNGTDTGTINLISIPANMIIDAVAIRKNVQFTGGVINTIPLTLYFSTADSTPPNIFLSPDLRGVSGLGNINFSYHSTEATMTSTTDGESSAPDITVPYFLNGQIFTNNGFIDELVDGNFDLWYKISKIPLAL